MQVLFDDTIIVIVYALMLALIIGLFIGAYTLYKKNKANAPVGDASSAKLTSNRGDDVGTSKFAKMREDDN